MQLGFATIPRGISFKSSGFKDDTYQSASINIDLNNVLIDSKITFNLTLFNVKLKYKLYLL